MLEDCIFTNSCSNLSPSCHVFSRTLLLLP